MNSKSLQISSLSKSGRKCRSTLEYTDSGDSPWRALQTAGLRRQESGSELVSRVSALYAVAGPMAVKCCVGVAGNEAHNQNPTRSQLTGRNIAIIASVYSYFPNPLPFGHVYGQYSDWNARKLSEAVCRTLEGFFRQPVLLASFSGGLCYPSLPFWAELDGADRSNSRKGTLPYKTTDNIARKPASSKLEPYPSHDR
jgi:hypothetical protein